MQRILAASKLATTLSIELIPHAVGRARAAIQNVGKNFRTFQHHPVCHRNKEGYETTGFRLRFYQREN
jgi:hypothetical protein